MRAGFLGMASRAAVGRISLLNELLSGFGFIKLLTWEKKFYDPCGFSTLRIGDLRTWTFTDLVLYRFGNYGFGTYGLGFPDMEIY